MSASGLSNSTVTMQNIVQTAVFGSYSTSSYKTNGVIGESNEFTISAGASRSIA